MTILGQGVFVFDPNDKIYRYHFVDSPIIPGVLIINFFIEEIKKSSFLNNFQIKSFKFFHFSSPGKFQFKIEQDEYSFYCHLTKGDKTHARGIILSI